MSLNEIKPEEIQRIYKGFSRNAETFNLIVERKNGKKKIVIRFCNQAFRDLAFDTLKKINTMKIITIVTPEGLFGIDAHIVADNYAQSFAELEKDSEKEYKKKYASIMSNNFELIDWLQNNMTWEEVQEHAEIMNRPKSYIPEGGEDFWYYSDNFDVE